MPDATGISHIALTVTDLDTSVSWYKRVFGAGSVARDDDGSRAVDVLVADGLLVGLNTHAGTEADDRFSETRVGLDHVAIQCRDAESVESWQQHLDDLGIAHSGIQTSPFGTHLNFKDPDGIALEIFAPSSG